MQTRSTFYGKRFSILGDSISTFMGYNPNGYNVFYAGQNCEKSGVTQVNDTWWDKVIRYFGGELLINNSWSGSRVTKMPGSERLFPSDCSDERTSSLHINDVKPDVIIVFLGTNDWAYGAKTGNDTVVLIEDDNEIFKDAYETMLEKLRSNYPMSEIWCCTLSETYISSRPDFSFPQSYAGTHIEEYNDVIRAVVREKACKLIDLYAYKTPYDSIDGSHPTKAGMNTIAQMIINTMTAKDEGENTTMYTNQQNMMNSQLVRYCRNCGTVIKVGDVFCGNCGTKVNVEQPKNFCRTCGANNSINAAFCKNCGAQFQYMNPQTGYVYSPQLPQTLSMGWYKFIIYFQLWAAMVVGIGNGIMYLTGMIYYTMRTSPEFIYNYWGMSLKIADVVYGVVLLLLAAFAVVTRQMLAKFKKSGPMLYYIYLILQLCVSLLYVIITCIIAQTVAIEPSSVSSIVISITMIIVNVIYFKKRKHLFVN